MSNQSVPKTNNLYAQDYHLWLEHTAYLLKNKKFLELCDRYFQVSTKAD
ncbi:hypothetical protein [Nostoc sp.]